MMEVTQILMDEHQVILKELERIEKILNENTVKANIENIEHSFDFIRDYSDSYHHAKEEDIYFKWMIKNNPNMKSGPIARMLLDHDEFRDLVGKGKEEFKLIKDDTKDSNTEQFKLVMNDFILKLRHHIGKEDHVLYMMAEQINASTQDGDLEMLEDFKAVNLELSDTIQRFI